ncbi:MAG: UDP-3-O-(3-hydroxymyristoyl)glucosamine N-acyltransferase [Candidatus Omnitrophica bacterium]|nr:UDP-3-O-(3-hydroxymyristoyl)glucosamine N-acyltransferase [Candidatus Omnitrophota bacterium]
MQKTLAEIAALINGELIGDGGIVIKGLNGIREAAVGEITFVANAKYAPLINKTQASAVICPRDLTVTDKPVIRTDDPTAAFASIMPVFSDPETYLFTGVHPSAQISDGAILGKNVTLGPNVVIEPKVEIGDEVIIGANTFVGFKSRIGSGSHVFPNVTIGAKSSIGERVKIFSGTVIGADGFGFEQVNGTHQKIPQLGIVVIEDDVEIGANVTIDRARFSKTVIGRGSKIDNLVQIGHNVIIGEHCIIISQVGISGSTIIEKNSILAGQAGVAGHLTIGAGSVVAAQAGVTGSLPPNSKVSGYPAKPHDHAKRVNAHLQKLPEYVKRIKSLENKIIQEES